MANNDRGAVVAGFLAVLISTGVLTIGLMNPNNPKIKMSDVFNSELAITGASSRVSLDFGQGKASTQSAKSMMVEKKNYGITPYDTVNYFTQTNPCGVQMQRLKGASQEYKYPAERAFKKMTAPLLLGPVGRWIVSEVVRTEPRPGEKTKWGYCPADALSTGNCAQRAGLANEAATAGLVPGKYENITWRGDASTFENDAEKTFTAASESLQPIKAFFDDMDSNELNLYADLYSCMVYNAKPKRVLGTANNDCNSRGIHFKDTTTSTSTITTTIATTTIATTTDPNATTAAATTTTAANLTSSNGIFEGLVNDGCFNDVKTINDMKYINFLMNMGFFTHTSGRSEFAMRSAIVNGIVNMHQAFEDAGKSTDKGMDDFNTQVVDKAASYTPGTAKTHVELYEQTRATDAGASYGAHLKAHGKGPHMRRDTGSGNKSPKQYRDGRPFDDAYKGFKGFTIAVAAAAVLFQIIFVVYDLRGKKVHATFDVARQVLWVAFFAFMAVMVIWCGIRIWVVYGSVPAPSRSAQECIDDFQEDNADALTFLKNEFVKTIVLPVILLVVMTMESFMRKEIKDEWFKQNKKEVLMTVMMVVYFASYLAIGMTAARLEELNDDVDSNQTSVQRGLCSPNAKDLGTTYTNSTITLAVVGILLCIGAIFCLSVKKRHAFGFMQMAILTVLIITTVIASSLYEGAVSGAIYRPEREERMDRTSRNRNKATFFAFSEFVMPLISLGMLVTYAVITEIDMMRGTFASMREFI